MNLPHVSLQTFRRLTLLGVVLLGLIVVTGGVVRLTSSGLGCPTWPQCADGSLVPHGRYAVHGAVEFGNRLVSAAVGVLMLVLPLASLRLSPRRRDLTLLSLGLWVGFLGQAGIGFAQYFLGVPVGLVGLHVAGATLLWIFSLRLMLALSAPRVLTVSLPGPAAQTGAPSPHREPASSPV